MEAVFAFGVGFGSALFDGLPPRFVSSRFMGDADFRSAFFTNGSDFSFGTQFEFAKSHVGL
jgi:hypothetical protein